MAGGLTVKKLSVEIANTPSTRETGLMHRKKLDDNSGMLFQFNHSDYLRFWMKNTYIPLDIAFLDEDGTIFQIAEMYPLSTRLVSSNKPCKIALEVNHGWFDKNKLGVGDKVGGLEIANKTYRAAQSTIGNPAYPANAKTLYPQNNKSQPPTDQSTVQPNNVPDQSQTSQNTPNIQENQVTPDVQVELDNKAKVKYAEMHNLAMQIIYQSKQSGQTLPPRKLIPVQGEGYPIRVSEGGEYFVAYDSSPNIMGGGWEILGNQIKRFLFNNIIALEVL